VGGINVGGGKEEEYVRILFHNEDKRIEIAKYLMTTYEWDFFYGNVRRGRPFAEVVETYLRHPSNLHLRC
jgi:hypothetical protein